MDKLSLDKTTLKKFAIIMFVALTIIGTILLLKNNDTYIWFYSSGIVLFLLSIFATNLIKPVYITWMKFAFILGWLNTRLILSIMFYLVFSPIGLLMRLFGVDMLDRKIEKNKESYWKNKDKKEFKPGDYERQF
jgi:hypothetical protein